MNSRSRKFCFLHNPRYLFYMQGNCIVSWQAFLNYSKFIPYITPKKAVYVYCKSCWDMLHAAHRIHLQLSEELHASSIYLWNAACQCKDIDLSLVSSQQYLSASVVLTVFKLSYFISSANTSVCFAPLKDSVTEHAFATHVPSTYW